jgi:hypothetical protein
MDRCKKGLFWPFSPVNCCAKALRFIGQHRVVFGVLGHPFTGQHFSRRQSKNDALMLGIDLTEEATNIVLRGAVHSPSIVNQENFMNQAFICDAIRTPFGRYGGALSSVRTDDLGAMSHQRP